MACITGTTWDLCAQGQNTGGIDVIKICDAQEIDAVTVDAATGAITAITLLATATDGFVEIPFENEGADVTTDINVTKGVNVVSISTALFTTPQIDAAKLFTAETITGCACGMLIYYKDLNGKEFLIGSEGSKQRAFVTNINMVTGRAFEDENTINWTLVARGQNTLRDMTGVALPTV